MDGNADLWGADDVRARASTEKLSEGEVPTEPERSAYDVPLPAVVLQGNVMAGVRWIGWPD